MYSNENQDHQMLLGLHTYSLYLHGIGQEWAGFELPWERQLGMVQLFDLGVQLGLDGFHVDDGALESLESSYLSDIKAEAKKRHLFLEFNMSLDLGKFGIGKQNHVEDGLKTAKTIGADVMKVGMDLLRPRPRVGS